jgi:putative heme iron utilization protein
VEKTYPKPERTAAGELVPYLGEHVYYTCDGKHYAAIVANIFEKGVLTLMVLNHDGSVGNAQMVYPKGECENVYWTRSLEN